MSAQDVLHKVLVGLEVILLDPSRGQQIAADLHDEVAAASCETDPWPLMRRIAAGRATLRDAEEHGAGHTDADARAAVESAYQGLLKDVDALAALVPEAPARPCASCSKAPRAGERLCEPCHRARLDGHDYALGYVRDMLGIPGEHPDGLTGIAYFLDKQRGDGKETLSTWLGGELRGPRGGISKYPGRKAGA